MNLKKYLFTFDPSKKGLRKILGDLEAAVMEVVWSKRETTVRQVYDKLTDQRDIAYTTVMTVMSRLSEKGLLERTKLGAAFVYNATFTKEEFTQSSVKKVITELLEDFSTPAITQFVESIGEEKPEKIEELARIIEEKRKEKNV